MAWIIDTVAAGKERKEIEKYSGQVGYWILAILQEKCFTQKSAFTEESILQSPYKNNIVTKKSKSWI